MRIETGKLFALFSFDVGYEIDLERLRRYLAAGERQSEGGDRTSGPPRVEYPSPPLMLPAEPRDVVVVERPMRADVSLRVHEFGVVTVMFSMPLGPVEVEGLPGFTAALTRGGTLEAEARAVLHGARPRIAPSITRPEVDGGGLVEDYYVLQVTRFEPAVDAAALLGTHRGLLARIIHCEPEELSASEIDEVLRTAVTYTPNDLVVTDWNVGVVYDTSYEDTLHVLEHLNVQLLELRYLDRMLDRRINALYERVGQAPRPLSFRREVVRAQELSELRLDTATLRERMINALKLLGDLYLTKVYARTADRLHLPQWQRSVDGKLELIQTIVDVYNARAANARAELLELTIVLLIVLEIVLAFFLPS